MVHQDQGIAAPDWDKMDFNTTQHELRDALAKKDFKYFEIALHMGADPLLRNDPYEVCVFESVLSTYGCGKFVELCLDHGCSPHYVNQRLSKVAIDYAADSKDPQIINALLRYSYVKVNRKLCPLSPVNSLIINANNDNADDVAACLKSLLEYGARVSTCDRSQQTPFDHLAQNRQLKDGYKRQAIEQLLRHSKAQESYRSPSSLSGPMHVLNGDLRVMSVTRTHHSRLPPTFPKVCGGNLEEFREQFGHTVLSENDKVSLILESIQEDEDDILDFLLANQADYNGNWDNMSPLLFALTYGNSYALKRLLDQDDLDIAAVECPLSIVIENMAVERLRVIPEHRRCFYLLLNCSRLDINESDSNGNTALSWALNYHMTEAIRELLKRGAYIGANNCNNTMSLHSISSKQLQECFDGCISTNDSWQEDNFEIQLNFNNIMAPQTEMSNEHFSKEMAAVASIAASKEHRYLLQHPLISSFLWLKWHQLSFVFYTNLTMYMCFALSFMVYTILRFSSWKADGITTTFCVMTWLGIVYMLVREFLQYLKSSAHYFHSPKNYVELLIIVLAIIACSNDNFEPDNQKTISVCTMLLIAVELFLLLGYLPVLSMSTHMLMLEAVCLTFLKSFMLYSVFLITFSMCFYTMFNKGNVLDADNAVFLEDDVDGADDDSNLFSHPLKAVIKTIVMLTGEFDAGSIEFGTFYSYLLFLLFVFLMTIVLYNLLNGLAVSDIQTLKGQAELNGAICRTKWLTRNEGNLSGHSKHVQYLLDHPWLRPICRRFLRRYPRYRQIVIRLNSNRVRIITSDEKEERDDIQRIFQWPEIDPEITKMAMAILEKNQNASRPQANLQSIENRLHEMENKIEEIYEMLKNLQK